MQSKHPHIVIAVTNDVATDQRMGRVAQSLVDARYEVTIVGRRLADSLPLDDLAYSQDRLEVSFASGPLMYAAFNLALYHYLLDSSPALIIAVDLDTIAAVSRAASRLGVPFLYDAHEYFTEVPELAGRAMRKAAWAQLARLTVPRAAACITVNQSLAAILGRKYSRHFEVIRNVPIYRRIPDTTRASPRRLIYQGVLNRGRWVEQYIEMMPLLPADIELHLYGDGDLAYELQLQARQSSAASRIMLHGRYSPEQLQQETPQAWLGLNMLDGDSLNYFYSLANKFFDYMHAGVPSINSQLPEYEAILDTTLVGVTVHNTLDSLVAAILRLYDDPSAYSMMREAALRAAVSYSWQEEKNKLISLVDRQLST